ncbi:MAG: hypothetical protein V3U85_10265 [Hyphomicrobium sp.]
MTLPPIKKLGDTWRGVRPQLPEPNRKGVVTKKDLVTWTMVVAPLTTVGLAVIHYIVEPLLQWSVRWVFPDFNMADGLELAFASLFALYMARKWKY